MSAKTIQTIARMRSKIDTIKATKYIEEHAIMTNRQLDMMRDQMNTNTNMIKEQLTIIREQMNSNTSMLQKQIEINTGMLQKQIEINTGMLQKQIDMINSKMDNHIIINTLLLTGVSTFFGFIAYQTDKRLDKIEINLNDLKKS
jgi:hypothetical protein